MTPNNIRELLLPLVGEDLVDSWYTSPNKAFDNKTPEQMFEEGKRKEVFDYLIAQMDQGS